MEGELGCSLRFSSISLGKRAWGGSLLINNPLGILSSYSVSPCLCAHPLQWVVSLSLTIDRIL